MAGGICGLTGPGVTLLKTVGLRGVMVTGARGVEGARTVGACTDGVRKFKDGVRAACGVRVICGVVREGVGVDGRLIEGRVIEARGITLCLCGVGVEGRLGAGVAGRLAARCAAAPVRDACPCKGTVSTKAIATAKAAEIALKRVFFT